MQVGWHPEHTNTAWPTTNTHKRIHAQSQILLRMDPVIHRDDQALPRFRERALGLAGGRGLRGHRSEPDGIAKLHEAPDAVTRVKAMNLTNE